jgi:hypothetical protein
MIVLMVVLMAPLSMAGLYTYSNTPGNVLGPNWSEVSYGSCYNTATEDYEPIADLFDMTMGTYYATIDGWQYFAFGGQANVHFHITPTAWIGARFQVSGENVAGFDITNVDASLGSNVVVQVRDDMGVVLATASGSDNNFSVSNLNTSYIDIVMASLADTNVHVWSANKFGVGNVEITTVPEPATIGVLGFGGGCLMFLNQRKNSKD